MPKNKTFPQETEVLLGLINSEKTRDLCKFLFLDYLNQTELFARVNPKRYKEFLKDYKLNLKSRTKSANTNQIVNTFRILRPYFENPKIEKTNYNFIKKRHRLSVDFYFEYTNKKLRESLKEEIKGLRAVNQQETKWLRKLEKDRQHLREVKKDKEIEYGIHGAENMVPLFSLEEGKTKEILGLNNVLTDFDKEIWTLKKDKKKMKKFLAESKELKEFSKIEKKIICSIFEVLECRRLVCRHENLILGVTSFLEKIFLHEPIISYKPNLGMDFIKVFFLKNKEYVKIHDDPDKQYREFIGTVTDTFSRLELKLKIMSDLRIDGILTIEQESPIKDLRHVRIFDLLEPHITEQHITEQHINNFMKEFSK